jgi:hypothetical protein
VSTRELEDEAIALLRKAAADRLPVDAGSVAKLAAVVRAAYDKGGRDAWSELMAEEKEAAAWRHRQGYPNP